MNLVEKGYQLIPSEELIEHNLSRALGEIIQENFENLPRRQSGW